ncbi:MAG TPA: serine/threonine-protein kinase [Phycisphaerales bacterium]|nr:serine/threonine-protein kinase [Phycisphaerales bacterium]HMP36921.1 serine/threonine-protein kinase [Phycisphaerales bacterium]
MSDRANAIVERALAFPPEQREAYLHGACDGDAALRGRVDRLLHAAQPHDGEGTTFDSGPQHRAAACDDPQTSAADGATLDRPAGSDSGAAAPNLAPAGATGEGPGSVIGRYRILQAIGEGGFGTVFMAEQKEPVRRRVALKIIKLGMDTRQVIARFEAERQALAMMDHPNIARVLDAGATEAGRPYFVMELVRGVPITEFCDRNGLTIRERLALMIPVCHAIQHAHQKGIIHRDLKPSNVLVTLNDGSPTPKVIDFGIAKATSSDLTEKTLFTEFRQFVGTPEFMSPEQAEMSGLDVDTRTDVYSLGALVYTLVTGAAPFDPRELRSRSIAEIQRLIVDSETPRPSTRLTSLGEGLAEVARLRRTEPGRLRTLLRGELDWIVLKAMEKDRTRRYDTARDLADDLRRHLDNEPVLAAPPSRIYRLRKLVRRNRAAATTVALIAAALVLAVIGTSWGMLRARTAETAARAAALGEATQRLTAEENERRAIEAAELASREAARALAAERAAEARASEFEAMTAFQTSMIQAIDVARMGERMREDVLAEIRESMRRRELPEAEIAARMAEADALLAEANFSNPAILGIERTILARAERQIVEQFADRPLIQARLLRSVAETRSVLGFGAEAEADFRRIAALLAEHLGDGDPRTITATALVAAGIAARGDWVRASVIYAEAGAAAEAALGADHPLSRVIGYLAAGGNIDPLLRRGDPEEIFWWSEITPGMSRAEAELAAQHIPRIYEIIDGLGIAQGTAAEMLDDATIDAVLGAFDEVARLLGDALGDGNPLLVGFKTNAGRNARTMGRPERAEPYLREALEAQRRMFGDAHPATVLAMLERARALYDLGQRDESYAIARQGLAAVRREHGAEHPLSVQVLDVMVRNLVGAGRDADAAAHLREVIDIQRRTIAATPTALAAAFAIRGSELIEAAGPRTLPLVEEMLAECVAIREATMPESWLTANARSMLGEAIFRGAMAAVGQPARAAASEAPTPVIEGADRNDGTPEPDDLAAILERFAEAERLLTAGYEALLATEERDATPALPLRRRQAAERLLRLTEAKQAVDPAAGHAAEIDRWRAAIESLRAVETQ